MDWLNWIIGIASFAVLALLLVDAALVEIPWVRRFRGLLVGLILVLWGVVIGRASGDSDEPVVPPPAEPEKFDDEEERKADAEADDLDIESAAADRELTDLVDANDGLRERLEKSKRVQDSLSDSE